MCILLYVKSGFNENICAASTHSHHPRKDDTIFDPNIYRMQCAQQYLKTNFIEANGKNEWILLAFRSECDRMENDETQKKNNIIPNVVQMSLVCIVSIKSVGEIRNLWPHIYNIFNITEPTENALFTC